MKTSKSKLFITEIDQPNAVEQSKIQRRKIRKTIAKNIEHLDLPNIYARNHFFQSFTLKSQAYLEERFNKASKSIKHDIFVNQYVCADRY